MLASRRSQALLCWILGAAVFACTDIKHVGGGAGWDLPLLDVVYVCTDDYDRSAELCWDSGADTLAEKLNEIGWALTKCVPTPRHLGPCIFSCPSGRGCNALNGCACFGDS